LSHDTLGTTSTTDSPGHAQKKATDSKPRLLTPTFMMAWLINFSQFLVFYCLVTTMALYAIKQFAASDTTGGLASSAFVIGATVARLFTGYVVDTLGQRRTLLVALIVVAVICALYVPANSLSLLLIVRFVHGLGYAFAGTAAMAMAQTTIPAARRAEGTGYFAVSATLASAFGPALGLIIVNRFDYTMLFLIALGVAVVGMVLGLVLHLVTHQSLDAEQKVQRKAARAAEPKASFSLRDIAHPAVIPIGCFMLLVGLCYAGVITYLNSYSEQRDVVTGAGFFFIAYAGAMLVMRFVLGKVQDQHGDNIVVYLGLVFFALALALLAIANTNWEIVVAGALTGLGYGTLMPASQAIAVNLVSADKLGTGISTLLLLTDVGVGLGPIALGILVAQTGYALMYGILAVIVVAAGIFYHFAHGHKQHAGAKAPAARETVA
jgi:MFS family permease